MHATRVLDILLSDKNILIEFSHISLLHFRTDQLRMDSTVGESIEQSVKSVPPCDASSVAEEMSVPVDEEAEEVDIAADGSSDDEHESVHVNGLLHESTTSFTGEINSNVSVDTPEAINTYSTEPQSTETLEDSGVLRCAVVLDEDDENGGVQSTVANEAVADASCETADTGIVGAESANTTHVIEDSSAAELMDGDSEDSNQMADESPSINLVDAESTSVASAKASIVDTETAEGASSGVGAVDTESADVEQMIVNHTDLDQSHEFSKDDSTDSSHHKACDVSDVVTQPETVNI